jgi:hypothetical protein
VDEATTVITIETMDTYRLLVREEAMADESK